MIKKIYFFQTLNKRSPKEMYITAEWRQGSCRFYNGRIRIFGGFMYQEHDYYCSDKNISGVYQSYRWHIKSALKSAGVEIGTPDKILYYLVDYNTHQKLAKLPHGLWVDIPKSSSKIDLLVELHYKDAEPDLTPKQPTTPPKKPDRRPPKKTGFFSWLLRLLRKIFGNED